MIGIKINTAADEQHRSTETGNHRCRNQKKQRSRSLFLRIICFALCFGMSVNSFANNHFSYDVKVCNAPLGHRVEFYDDGRSLVIGLTSEGYVRGWGTYSTKQGNKIEIRWDNGVLQRGTYTFTNNQVQSIEIEGIKYTKCQ